MFLLLIIPSLKFTHKTLVIRLDFVEIRGKSEFRSIVAGQLKDN